MASCGEALIRLLEAYDVDTVFGIPGVHTIELYRGLAAASLRHVTPRHEQGAGFMADGYARASGKPGVCLIITGPGMTNIATAMGQALADSIPMLVLSSVNHRHQLGLGEGRLHEMPDQSATMAGVAVFSHTLMRPDELPQVMARAFTVFASERPGPVHIELPLDVIGASADHLELRPYALPNRPGPSPAVIQRAADLLNKARRPLLAIGGGCIDASAELVALAEQLDAPVVNTVNAKGVIPYSHPLAVGGSGSCQAVRDEFQQADVVLAVGTEFSETDYDFSFVGPPGIGGQLIRVDIDPRQLSRNLRSDIAIHSDARIALQAIAAALPPSDAKTAEGEARALALRTALVGTRDKQYEAFFRAIRKTLPEVLIAGDSTQPTYYAWLHYETEHARRYFHSASGFGTLGYAIPAAIGAKLARPDLPVIGLIGDGASQFTIGELASAAELDLPVIFVIWNNNGYGEISRFMDQSGVSHVGVEIFTPDFMVLGRGFGCEVASVANLEQFAKELLSASLRKGPTVIEVVQSNVVDGYPE